MRVGIIGGGASGIMSALLLKKAQPSWSITIYEARERVATKLLKTGNGRCNLGHSGITAKDYPFDWTEQLALFPEKTFINIFKDLGIYMFKDEEGRYYPESESSKQVVSILLKKCEEYHITIKTNTFIKHIILKNNTYIIDNESYDALIIATGGKSQSNYTGEELFKNLNLKTIPFKPALVGLKTVESIKPLTGLRRKAILKAHNFREAGEVQFKDEGVSGIVVMNYSRYAHNGDTFSLDLVPHYSLEELNELVKSSKIEDVLNGLCPRALADYIFQKYKDIKVLKNFTLTIKDTYNFNDAQISLGGVSLKEIDNHFASLKYPNMYITGEALNNDGACGGYNLYFAWLSSYIACLDLGKKNLK